MKKIILSLFLLMCSFDTWGAVYFITGETVTGFSSSSYGCAKGWHLASGKCAKNICPSETYPLSSKPDATTGKTVFCNSGDDTFYGQEECNNGWTLQSGICIANSCNGYPYSSSPDATAGTIISCNRGNDVVYGYSSCKSGWTLSNGRCDANICSGYPYSTKPDSSIGTISATTCKSGGETRYKYASCKTGWDLNNGACEVHICDANVYINGTCPANATCAPCYTGGSIRYASASCNSGYTLSGGVCVESCTYTITDISNCKAYDSCTKGGNTYYKCLSCIREPVWGDNSADCYKPASEGCGFKHGKESDFYIANDSGNALCGYDLGDVNRCWYKGERPVRSSITYPYVKKEDSYAMCRYSRCTRTDYAQTLRDGMCWCSGKYQYNGDEYWDIDGTGSIYPWNISHSFTSCADTAYHTNIHSWRPILEYGSEEYKEFSKTNGIAPYWRTYGDMKYYQPDSPGPYPVIMFADFCRASGAHLMTKEDILRMIAIAKSNSGLSLGDFTSIFEVGQIYFYGDYTAYDFNGQRYFSQQTYPDGAAPVYNAIKITEARYSSNDTRIISYEDIPYYGPAILGGERAICIKGY